VGRKLIVDWKLSSEFTSIVSDHHSPRETGDAGCCWNTSELIKVSCRLADCIGFPAFPGCEATPYEDLLDMLPPAERSLLPGDVQELEDDVNARIQGVESGNGMCQRGICGGDVGTQPSSSFTVMKALDDFLGDGALQNRR
jgi:hypothetical protein